MVDTMPDKLSAGVGVVIVDARAGCSVAAAAVEKFAVLAGAMVAVVAIDRVVEGCGPTASATTRLSPTVPVGVASTEGADAGADVLVSFPKTGFDAARNRVVCRRAAFVGQVFESVAEWVGAGTSFPEVSCAARVLGVGVAACEDGVDSRSCGAVVAASSDVLELLRAPPVLTTTLGAADRVARRDDPDGEVTGLIGAPADVSDPDTVDGDESDEPDSAAVPEPVAPCDDVLDPEDAVELVDEDFPVEELDAESDEEEPELDGLAQAIPGDAASPTPMPNATANAPIRPIHLA
jgi:hypothetical protein